VTEGVLGGRADDLTCPCGGRPAGTAYRLCCGPVIDGEVTAETAEALMRSRYAAYARGATDHLFRTWHPRTRPVEVDPDPRVRWVRLTVLGVEAGAEGDDTGVVEFRAQWVSDDGAPVRRGVLHERSRFARRACRWFYVDAAG
jgi:SEC-C motif-containing protein